MALSCPFRQVAQREPVAAEHVHRFLAELMLDDGTWVQDCACGHRQRARKNAQGIPSEVFADGMVPGGSSLDNAIFARQLDGSFQDRWAFIH